MFAMPLRPAFTLELIALRGGPGWFTEVSILEVTACITAIVSGGNFCEEKTSTGDIHKPIRWQGTGPALQLPGLWAYQSLV